MIQSIRKFKVTKNECPTKELCRIWLEPADGEAMFEFKQGQFVMVHELDSEGNSKYVRSYSIASAPSESVAGLELGIKSQGRLSGILFNAKPGDIFGVQGPYGMFSVPEDKKVVFFSGGVGITPFRSMIRAELLKKSDKQLTLFYSGRTIEDLIYHKEFLELAKENPNFIYVPILTREHLEDWDGEYGRFDDDMIKRYVKDFKDASYLMCGPVLMMDHVKEVLESEGVDVKGKLKAERY
ncbi:MAG: FAD-dependent oxidoreductase [Patescibacteria group bacterium]|nr:FAD-dependent oxidoreductase [Patescibacteria group bacterium]